MAHPPSQWNRHQAGSTSLFFCPRPELCLNDSLPPGLNIRIWESDLKGVPKVRRPNQAPWREPELQGDPRGHGCSPPPARAPFPEKQPTSVTLIYPVTVNEDGTCPVWVLPRESDGLWLERKASRARENSGGSWQNFLIGRDPLGILVQALSGPGPFWACRLPAAFLRKKQSG